MSHSHTRRHFLTKQAPSCATLALAGLSAPAAAQDPKRDPPAKEPPKKPAPKPKKPRLDLELVREFVAEAHRNLDKVKELLEKEPGLINATHDWGGGDFETVLGGASHTGQRAIAEFLLEKGARLDIFAATMLGKLDVVKSAVAAFPGIVNVPGPHGIPLLVHARTGKKEAEPVLKYLESLTKKA